MCVQDIRDPMGYAVIEKNKVRDPPLPPPRLPPRQKRSENKLTDETKFFTVPRSSEQNTPVRPLRNYSTLGQIKFFSDASNPYENKENIDVTQYIEIEDEPSRDLQSGEVIKKMKDRPLPAPPRPPRKSRPLRDITSTENLPQAREQQEMSKFDETEVSTQTEPLPDDFICDELVQEPTDKIIIPTTDKDIVQSDKVTSKEQQNNPTVVKQLITPTSYTYEEETITHGSILVEALNGATIIPYSELQKESKERIVPIATTSDDETSSIPEDFKKLLDHHPDQQHQPQRVNIEPVLPEIIRANKLQVTDLDVDTLSVNKLVADKIVCSDIESDNIQTTDLNSKNTALKIGDISLPQSVIAEIIKSLTSKDPTLESKPPVEISKEKKTPISENVVSKEKAQLDEDLKDHDTELLLDIEKTNVSDDNEILETTTDDVCEQITSSEEPPELVQLITEINEIIDNPPENHAEDTPPIPPPRSNSEQTASRLSKQINLTTTSVPQSMLEPEVDDEPPPRPPDPQLDYIPSQPPASFYALKAQKYVDDNIPVAPRRKRHTRSRARSRSSSEDSSTTRVSRRFPRRYSEVPLAQLSSQLIRACGNEINLSLKRLIAYVTNNVLGNANGTQDLNVMIIIVLVLIAGLILLGYGNEKTVVHLHHWEYFNPPRDL